MPSISRVLVIVLAGCGGGGGARATGPIEHLGPDEAPRADGLAVVELAGDHVTACEGHDLAVRVVATGQARDELILEGSCSGACTPEEQAEGEEKDEEGLHERPPFDSIVPAAPRGGVGRNHSGLPSIVQNSRFFIRPCA